MAIICSVNDLSYFSPPTATTRRDYFQPLHVDCSVEYELPNCAKPPLNAGIRSEPLLMIHPSYYRREEARHHEAFVNNLPPSSSPLKRNDVMHFGANSRPKDCRYDARSFRMPKGTRKRPLQPSLENPKIDLTTRLENYDFFGGGAIGGNRTDFNAKLWTKNTPKSAVLPLCGQASHPATPASVVGNETVSTVSRPCNFSARCTNVGIYFCRYAHE